MTDNTRLNIGSSGDLIRTIDEAGVKTQVVAAYGINDLGDTQHMAVTSEGHLEVAIHAPRLPFGAVHTEKLTPEFQIDAVYGVNPASMTGITSLSGTATAANNMFVCSTGTTQYGSGVLQSRKRLRYRPGQGLVARFTALWPGSAANSIVIAGVGSAEAGFYYGFNGTQFGILHVTDGIREQQTLTITTASSTTENITVTLGGVAHTVAVTNSANRSRTAYEISTASYVGWTAEQVGEAVVFLASSAGNKSGTFSVTGATVVGAFVETVAGANSVDTWYYQTEWNGDKLDGTGASGVTLDKTKGNVFQIDIQYLGFGAIVFKVEVFPGDGNNADFVTVHTLQIPNSRTTPSLSNPSFPFTMAAYSSGSTSDLSVKVASCAGFIEGEKKLTGSRFTYTNTSTSVAAALYYELFTIRNQLVYKGKANQGVINLISISAAVKHTQPVSILIFRNASLVGNVNFSQYSSTSLSCFDTAATSATISDNNQILFSAALAETGNINISFEDEITIQPGETISVVARAVTGTPAYVIASLNTREDQ
jgi:hypothetical protein